jgi:hypothetical protein
MFVIYDKKSGYVKMTCTEMPVFSFKFRDDWMDNYVLDEFPFTEFMHLTEYFLQVVDGKLKVIGKLKDLKEQGLPYSYDGFAKLFIGE